MSKPAIAGWTISTAGSVLWIYGYFVTGHPPLLDWQAHTPHWIAEFLPNIEAEIGMMCCIGGMIPMYWPAGASE